MSGHLIRSLLRGKLNLTLNLLSLTVGFISILYVSLYIKDELTYDSFHPNADNLYRLNLQGRFDNQDFNTSCTSFPVASAIQDNVPGIIETTRVYELGDVHVKLTDESFVESSFIAADSNFFHLFGFSLFNGNPGNALVAPHSIVISKQLEDKYFDGESALNKTFIINDEQYVVTGIMENRRADTHLVFDAVVSYSTFPFLNQNEWLANMIYTYYTLDRGVTPTMVDEKLLQLTDMNVGLEWKEAMGKTMDQFKNEGGIYRHFSIPVQDIHLTSTLDDEPQPVGSYESIYILAIIGVLILALASINYINLCTAESLKRIREIGIRRVLGSTQAGVIGRFVMECFVTVMASAAVSFALLITFLPYINDLSGKHINIGDIADPLIIGCFVILIGLVSVLSGLVPAFMLTKNGLTASLKGITGDHQFSRYFKNGLVVFQYMITIGLIVGALTVHNQLGFLKERDVGFDKHNLMVLKGLRSIDNHRIEIVNTLRNQAAVQSISFASFQFPGTNQTTLFRDKDGIKEIAMATYSADSAYLKTLRIQLIQGQYFEHSSLGNTDKVVINKAAFKALNWTNLNGKKLLNFDADHERVLEVIGVVDDFHFDDLYTGIKPLVIQYTDYSDNLYLRINGDAAPTVATLERIWAEMEIPLPLEYGFIDETINSSFRKELQLGNMMDALSVIALLLACLGVFGLSAFLSLQRSKEIAIRKSLGASSSYIIRMFAISFARLVLIAFVLAIGPAIYYAQGWLQNFTYRIELGLNEVLLSGFITLAVTLLTVMYHIYKVASIDVVRTLKYDQ